jgi:hypothetical protein
MITYNWEIVSKPIAPILGDYTDVVLAVIWKLIGTDEDGKSTDVLGTTFFMPPTENFVPIEEVTDEIIISWISDKENIEQYKTDIESKINKIL